MSDFSDINHNLYNHKVGGMMYNDIKGRGRSYWNERSAGIYNPFTGPGKGGIRSAEMVTQLDVFRLA